MHSNVDLFERDRNDVVFVEKETGGSVEESHIDEVIVLAVAVADVTINQPAVQGEEATHRLLHPLH